MAQLDDLIGEISDPALRQSVIESLQKLRANKRFGLVFEDHIPETVSLPGLPVRVGSSVQRRDDIGEGLRFRVTEIENGQATVESLSDDGPEPLELPVESLHAVRRFGESIYPGLVPVSSVRGGPAERPVHMVLEAENFHAIQLLNYLYSGQVDCLILDPPFNTGDRTWRYSNRYVDNDDRYRHSKWLSFMERRLRLAKRLLKPDGVVIVYIDEHEVHHLGVLMEQIFRGARRQMVTIVNNAAGVTQGGFYRVEEYALFAFLGDAAPDPTSDDMLSDEATSKPTPIWFSLIRYGGVNALPSKRPGLVYPVAIDPGTDRIVATGRTIKERMDAGEVAAARVDEWRPDPDEKVDGLPVVWPYRKDGSLSTWQLNPKTLMALNLEGFVRVRQPLEAFGKQ